MLHADGSRRVSTHSFQRWVSSGDLLHHTSTTPKRDSMSRERQESNFDFNLPRKTSLAKNNNNSNANSRQSRYLSISFKMLDNSETHIRGYKGSYLVCLATSSGSTTARQFSSTMRRTHAGSASPRGVCTAICFWFGLLLQLSQGRQIAHTRHTIIYSTNDAFSYSA